MWDLDIDRIDEVVYGSDFWSRIVYLEQVGSTNDVAKELASLEAPEGILVVAEQQTAGRGRLRRRWVAPAGSSLLFSILFRPGSLPSPISSLTMLCSMATADAIQKTVKRPVALKWPNDLIIESHGVVQDSLEWRKLAGILTETGMTGSQAASVVVGIGINVNVPAVTLPELAANATSMLVEAGRKIDRSALLIDILRRVETRYFHLKRGCSPQREWSSRLATLGRYVQVRTSTGVIEGIAEGVSEDGALLLRTQDGRLQELRAGDVTLAQA